mmetsp:Transcript_76333/g.221616  ORF Transcript_76333/g.221616 Transcript_76333/m.221616 type:complete len:239 (-) Transcript_76333:837-1553(-)
MPRRKWSWTFLCKRCTDSATTVSMHARDAAGSWSNFSNSLLMCASALRATLAASTMRPSGVALTPRKSQSFGAVVAFTTSVMAATPPTRNSTRSPSSPFSACSRSTKMARAKPTIPRRPPHVITRMSLRGTLAPQRLSNGHNNINMPKRIIVIATYTTKTHMQSFNAWVWLGMTRPVSMPAKQNTIVLPKVSMTCQNSWTALRSTRTGHILCAKTNAAATVLSTPEMWKTPSANMKDQ